MKNHIKTTVNMPEWVEYFNNNGGMTNESEAYGNVAAVYRCARMISDSLSSTRLICKQGDAEIEFPFDMDVKQFIWNMEISILLTGAAYAAILKNTGGRKILGLQWLNPTTVQPQAMVKDGKQTVEFWRTGNVMGGSTSRWTADQMLYVKEFNLVDDILPGPSPAKVAMKDAMTLNYLTRFASYYFQRGAMPLTIMSVDRATQDAEVKRVENIFKQAITGIQNAFRFIVLRGGKDIQPFTVTPPLKDMVMPQLYSQGRGAVALAFGVPQTMLEDAANYATAKEHRLSYWQDTVRPRGVQLAGAMTDQLGKQLGMTFEFAFDELDIFQEDESQRAGSLSQLTSAGVPLVMAMEMLGYNLTDEQKLLLAAKPEPAAPTETVPTIQPIAEIPTDFEAVRSALHHWKTAALTAFKTGRDCDFTTAAIPDNWCDNITASLKLASDEAEIRAVFSQAEEWRKHAKAAEGY